jgi:hypothetical protein
MFFGTPHRDTFSEESLKDTVATLLQSMFLRCPPRESSREEKDFRYGVVRYCTDICQYNGSHMTPAVSSLNTLRIVSFYESIGIVSGLSKRLHLMLRTLTGGAATECDSWTSKRGYDLAECVA